MAETDVKQKSEQGEVRSSFPHSANDADKSRGGRDLKDSPKLFGLHDLNESCPARDRDGFGTCLDTYIKKMRGGSRGATDLHSTEGFALDWATMHAEDLKKHKDDIIGQFDARQVVRGETGGEEDEETEDGEEQESEDEESEE